MLNICLLFIINIFLHFLILINFNINILINLKIMKNKFLVLGLAVLLITSSLSFVGCKKGENDPGLSLKSRTARITGEWELSKGDWEELTTSTYSNTTSINKDSYSFDNGALSVTEFDGTNTDSYTIDMEYTLTIEKDGTYELVDKQTRNINGTILTTTNKYEGNWAFVYGNDNLEIKNKERVEFTYTKQTIIYTDGTTDIYNYSGKSWTGDNMLLLDKLASDEMVAIIDTKYVHDTYTSETTGSQTFLKAE